MATSGRSLGKLVIVIAAAYVAYQFLGGRETPPGGERAAPAGAEGDPRSSYALRAADTWPPLAEGAAQATVDEHLLAANYYVVLDASGSMNESGCSGGRRKIEAAQLALASFAESVPPDANLGLAVFENRGLGERLPLGRGNRQQFVQAAGQVVAGSGTPLRSAVELAYGRLLEQGRRQLGYGEYHLVVITDGIANEGQDPTDRVDAILAQSPVILHTVGFCIGEDHSLNQPGRTFYRAADNPEALRRGLDAVLAEAPSFDLDRFAE